MDSFPIHQQTAKWMKKVQAKRQKKKKSNDMQNKLT